MLTLLIGYCAAFCTSISFLPQVLKIIKTKDTSGISLYMYLIFFIGVLLWLIYGLLIKDAVVIIANLVTLILSGIVLVLKIREK